MIRKVGKRTWALFTKKKYKGRRRRLGTFRSRKAARKREGQIEYFKRTRP